MTRTLKRTPWMSGYEVRLGRVAVGFVTPTLTVSESGSMSTTWSAWRDTKRHLPGTYPTCEVAAEAVLLDRERQRKADSAMRRTSQTHAGHRTHSR